MNKLFPFLSLLFICLICACSKNSVAPQKQSVMIGNWQLQNQFVATYVNDALQFVTTSTSSGKSDMSITFGNNGAYTAVAVFGKSGRVALGDASSPGFTGNYSIKDGVFTMSPFLVGSMWLDTLFSPSKAIVFSNKIIAEKAAIVDTTATNLTFTTEITVQQTADNKTRNITTKTRYEYSR